MLASSVNENEHFIVKLRCCTTAGGRKDDEGNHMALWGKKVYGGTRIVFRQRGGVHRMRMTISFPHAILAHPLA